MEIVRYRPGEALRWLKVGAERTREEAAKKGRSVFRQTGMDQRGIAENLRTAAGAAVEFGRSKYADVMHDRAETIEYVLQADRLDVVQGSTVKTIPYAEIAGVATDDEGGLLVLEKGTIAIRPPAYLVAGRAKVPVGWVRNGVEVPFDLLLEEIAARAGKEVR